MSRIIVIANQKGGVAKTTTAHCVSIGLTHKKYKTLAVDLDPQGSLSYIMGADSGKPGVSELLREEILAPAAVQNVEQGAIITGNSYLSSISRELTGKDANKRLSEVLTPYRAVYDFIVIDTPPTLGLLSINALVAADDVIIPVTADALSLQGLSQLYSTIRVVKQRSNHTLNIAGLLLCRYDGRTVLARELRQIIADRAEQMGTRLFSTTIRDGVALKEAQANKANPFKSLFKSKPASDYLDFIEEYLRTHNV